jgi:hypothetical protein
VTRLGRFLADLREGRELGFPLCCCLRWALTYAFDVESEQACKRGVRFTADEIEYVPCGIFHQATVTHAEYERLLERRWLEEQAS